MLVYGISDEMGNSCALTFPPPESVQSGVGSPTSEWVLVGTIGSHELGTPERVAQLEKMKQRKTDHGETVVTCFQQLIV